MLLTTLILLSSISNRLFAQNSQSLKLKVVFEEKGNCFPLSVGVNTANLVTDDTDAEVVQIAAQTFADDITLVTGYKPTVAHQITRHKLPVIIGTIGHSRLIDSLVKSKKIDVTRISNQWETFATAMIDHPFKGIPRALVITGSDPRGTAYGVFELSRMIGVSPMVWWADVAPQHHNAIYITPGKIIVGPPSVKYRGIFLNDEDWGLHPWAAQNMDTDIKDIGPKTYKKVFELLLRLKANYIWPAMHPCTKAFWYYPENAKLAQRYSIVLGASHCEPMLRNNVFEWADNFKNEYGTNPGEWRYDVNQRQIYTYWDDRVKASGQNDAVYTIGMRGIHDGGMPGPPDKAQKVKILENVIHDQREILAKRLNKPANLVPQIFCPYKEVLDLYQAGLQLPDDVTIVWADDNYGYIRQLSNPAEQKRTGHSGVYYHLSYYGNPADYLWLSTNSPSLISYEMSKAYQFGADRVWIFNVGDIKPAESEIQFAMDMAWDVNRWTPEKAIEYNYAWAKETFGPKFAASIAAIKTAYYALAAAGKPEHTDEVSFSEAEIETRLKRYHAIATNTQRLAAQIPASLKNAYFELIQYPVLGACFMNEKIFYARKSLELAASGNQLAYRYAKQAQAAYDTIQQLTLQYNTTIANGKWNGIMSSNPRNRKVFKMPPVAKIIAANTNAPTRLPDTGMTVSAEIPAAAYTQKTEPGNNHIKIIKGLGIGGAGVTVLPFAPTHFNTSSLKKVPAVVYHTNMPAGENYVSVRCLPTFPIYQGQQLRYAISVNNGPVQLVSIATQAETKAWDVNVLRGFAEGEIKYQNPTAGNVPIRIYFPDPGLTINSIVIKHQP